MSIYSVVPACRPAWLPAVCRTWRTTTNLPIEVKAFSDSKLDIIVEQYHPDVILLGPQVKYKFNATRDKYEPQGIPVEVMNLDDYGNVNGEHILKRAIQLLKQNKQG